MIRLNESFGDSVPAGRLVSSLIALLAALVIVALPANAHEVRPAIADVAIDDTQLRIDISLNAEALLAGIDLDGLADTDEAENASDYDALRALDQSALQARFEDAADRILGGFTVLSGETPVTLSFDGVAVTAEPNLELPRDTQLALSGVLPADGSPVTIAWAREFGTLVVRQMAADGAGDDALYTGLLNSGAASEPIPRVGAAQQSALSAFITYVVSGFDHIIPKGLDHILFVLGLFFFSTKFRPLMWQVAAFTVAHTVTLALATLGIVSVPASIVEPLIAASIVYVAVENLFARGESSIRLPLIFAFGLLHGLGFASVLGDFGLAQGQFIVSLIGFNIGVELGQLTVIAIAYVVVGLWFNTKSWYRGAIANPASIAIALVGAWWVLERTVLA
ncbi:MAG: HupE/UreJ family protein [Pseudomonadota bacterium]